MKNVKMLLWGIPIGLINGFFGSGGGIAAVYVLKKFLDTEQKKAHATAISIILPLSAAGLFVYAGGLENNIGLIIKCAAGGIAGGLCGAKLLNKIPKKWLRAGFGGVMITASLRLIF